MSRDFHHPYRPYDIQVQLMDRIYDLLNSSKKIGIFESPTGTGKTLSLICSTVTWLREHKLEKLGSVRDRHSDESSSDFSSDDDDDNEPEWVNQFYNDKILKDKVQVLQQYEDYLDTLSNGKVQVSLRELGTFGGKNKKRKRATGSVHVDMKIGNGSSSENDDGSQFLPEPYEIGGAGEQVTDKKSQLNDEIQELLAKIGDRDDPNADKYDQNLDLHSPLKIFFASRTHSQLTQFASQLTLSSFPPSSTLLDKERIKFLPLASRKQLCIHEKVSRSRPDLINDSCAETVKKKECQFYTNSKDKITSREFRDHTFSQIHDIEDLVQLGKTFHTCPYYSSRDTLDGAEIVTLPYQHLLSLEVRQSLGIDLKDSIVIIDEAHNLIDTIRSIYSCEVSLSEIESCLKAIKIYFAKFKKRLNSGNRVSLLKLMKLLEVLKSFIEKDFSEGKEVLPQEIFHNNNIDLLNIHELTNYMKKSKIAYKIDSYTDWVSKPENSDQTTPSQPILFKISQFIMSLSNLSVEGKFYFREGKMIRYMLLEPQEIFKSIVQDSKCVILAGGTMQPVSDITESLFPYIPSDEIVQFSCDHIIPDSNLDTFLVTDGFNFNHENRNKESNMVGLYEFFLEIGKRVPDGVVAFFPSYGYLEQVVNFWKSKGMYQRLNSSKKIFYETKGGNDILPGYTDAISERNSGALLLSVVGGKLSEGINFQDELARAVVMVGLPYPNTFSSEMIVQRRHHENKVLSNGGSEQDAHRVTKEFYENICMKAVNQSVGRAIRHAKDYACIFLIDNRYLNNSIQQKLSHWVRKRIMHQKKTEDILEETSSFFAQKR